MNPHGVTQQPAPVRVHAGLTAEGLGAEVTADSLRAAMTPTDTGSPA